MTNDISENKKVTTEPEIGSNGVGHSTQGSTGGASKQASPAELTLALNAATSTIQNLQKELNELKKTKSEESSVDKLAAAIVAATAKSQQSTAHVQAVNPSENLNKSTDYSQRTLIDGTSLMEAQATLMSFKNEDKIPVSVPKTFVNQFGPSLAVSVNGVRVSIPCDGKTYFINETHAEAIRERIAKVDKLLADTESQVQEINA